MSDLAAADLRHGAVQVHSNDADEVRAGEVSARLDAAANLMDQGYRLTPPPQPGTVTVNADDLRSVLWDGYGGGEPWQEARRRVVAAPAGSALAEVNRDR